MVSSYSYRVDSNDEAVRKGITLGTILGKKLKLRNEERSLVTPRMKNGRISVACCMSWVWVIHKSSTRLWLTNTTLCSHLY